MTSDRDPVDTWLGADVEPLPPPPGAFERVHRGARRRKAVRATGIVVGAAVVAAAAATLPQVASGLLTGPSGGVAKVKTGSHSTGLGGRATAAPTTPARPPVRGLTLRAAGNGPPPAAGFRPLSVSFIGAGPGALLGAVPGAAGACGARPCMVIVGTPRYGARWSEVDAPAAGPPDGSSGVSQVRFHDPSNGWVYGPALYVTHDSGRNWHAITHLPGRVLDLSTAASRAFAVVGIDCAGTGSAFAANCARFSLFSAPVRGGGWRVVAGAAGSEPFVPGGLQLTTGRGYLIASGRLYAGPVTSGPWHAMRVAGPAAPSCLTRRGRLGPWLLAPTRTRLFLVCSRTQPAAGQSPGLYVSADGGRTWHASGAAPIAPASLAASPSGTLVLATRNGIYYSADARTWHRATRTAPAGGFKFVSMTTDSNGVAVPARPARAVYVTTDGGRTWQPRPIR